MTKLSSQSVDSCGKAHLSNKCTTGDSVDEFCYLQRSPSWKDVTAQHATGCPDQFGVPVNGFHPQWSSTSNLCLPSPLLNGSKSTSFSANNNRLNEKILELIREFQKEEKERSRRRGKLGAAPPALTAGSGTERRKRALDDATLDWSSAHKDHHQNLTTTNRSINDGKRIKIKHSCVPSQLPDHYGDVFLGSDVPQLIATSGGRVIACKYFS